MVSFPGACVANPRVTLEPQRVPNANAPPSSSAEHACNTKWFGHLCDGIGHSLPVPIRARVVPGRVSITTVPAKQSWAIFSEPLEAWQARALPVSKGSSLGAALAASLVGTDLSGCTDIEELFKVATELARNSIGLERVAFYLREPSAERLVLRGTWGTGARGETADERGLTHELSIADGLVLHGLRSTGAFALYRPRASWFALEGDRPVVLGEGWVMVTPLIHGQDLVGVMYNDAALTGAAVDPSKQAAAAVFAQLVTTCYAARYGPIHWQPLRASERTSALVGRIRKAIDQNLGSRGNELAADFGISPGHLARTFKRETGLSLVEYRNRKRIARFWEAIQRHGRGYSLKQAAFEAGFGSYAHFNRIHKKVLGVIPRHDALRNASRPAPAPHHRQQPEGWPSPQ